MRGERDREVERHISLPQVSRDFELLVSREYRVEKGLLDAQTGCFSLSVKIFLSEISKHSDSKGH